ncbi:MAG: RIP metalloprotease RseP [Minisyncoccia bacterium]
MSILFIIIGLSILILGHEFGHFTLARIFKVRVEEFGFGFPPRLFFKKKNDTIYSFNLIPLGGFVKLTGENDVAGGSDDINSFANKKAWQRSLIVLGGVIMNIFLGWLFIFLVLQIGIANHLVITNIIPSSPAAAANLKNGDIIKQVSIDNKVMMVDPIITDDFINLVNNNLNKTIQLTIQRGGKIIDVSLKPLQNPQPNQGHLGIGLLNSGLKAQPFFKAFINSFITVFEIIKLTFNGLVNLFENIFVKPSNVLNSVAGPVGIFVIMSDAFNFGFSYFLQLLALISLNLALLNVVPIPALDGGRLLFIIFEKILGKPLSEKTQMITTSVSFILLLLLIVFITINDLHRF